MNESPYTAKGEPRSTGESILLVDDEPELRRGVGVALRRFGFRVGEAGTNAEALSMLGREVPNLVLSDLNRPGGSGIDLLEAIRDDPRTAKVAVIFLTGNPSRLAAQAAKLGGAWHFFTKPVAMEELLQAIYDALGDQREPLLSLIDAGTETRDVDYKAALNLETKKARAELARDMIAMANAGGGTIVFGVAEGSAGAWSQVGLSPSEVDCLDVTKVGDAVRAYTGPAVEFATRVVRRGGLIFGAISVRPMNGTIALALKPNQDAGLFTGRIYVRTADARTAELTDPGELNVLIERAIGQRAGRIAALKV